MYYIYVLKSVLNSSLYIGITNNLERRLKEHNDGDSLYTKKYRPWVCIYIEGYFSEEDAKTREKNLKYFGKA